MRMEELTSGAFDLGFEIYKDLWSRPSSPFTPTVSYFSWEQDCSNISHASFAWSFRAHHERTNGLSKPWSKDSPSLDP